MKLLGLIIILVVIAYAIIAYPSSDAARNAENRRHMNRITHIYGLDKEAAR
jgi:hypothetical protein